MRPAEEGDDLGHDDGCRVDRLSVRDAGNLDEAGAPHGLCCLSAGTRWVDEVVLVGDHETRTPDAGVQLAMIRGVPLDVRRELPGTTVA